MRVRAARGRGLRVLHAPVEIAGQATLAVRGLRELGVDASVFAPPHPYGYGAPDIVPPSGRLELARTVIAAMREFDVFHFYYGLGFHPRLRLFDVRALRAAGKRVVVEFVGSDVRMPTIEAARNPNYVQIAGEDDAAAELRMRRWRSITGGHVVVSDHGLDPFVRPRFSHVHYVGLRVDVGSLTPRPPRADAVRPVVVHAPSDAAGKGTVHVRRAVEALRADGVALEYVEVSGSQHSELMRRCEAADIVIDQMCSGAHGVFAVEAMSLAKPVICNMLPEYAASLPPDCPIINADPDTLTAVLASWLARPQERHTLGIASRAYAERHHDIAVVARRLLEVYEELPGR
jgi:hypothetical protein